ncbi:unnamed protein product, partial [Oppiella nova]
MEFLEFKIDGNRNHYEDKDFKRRNRLMDLVLGELLTDNKTYVEQIANGLWLILEESTWTWPAHMSMQKGGGGMPDPSQWVLDLGAGESSAYVAWIRFLLGDKLTKLSPMFVKRMDYELDRRVVETFMNNDLSWMGFERQKVNNWNIWINTNILMTSLLTVNDTKRLDVIKRAVMSADNWLDWYGEDGGCDEGPSYWYEAAGRFIQFLYYISSASRHQMDWSSKPIVKSIGDESRTDVRMHQFYMEMIAYNSLKSEVPKAPQPLESWFPDLQVITLRSEEGSAKGLFLGAKAGTNDESHNHNDVGNFVLYVNGLPALIDIGVGTYTKDTFGPHRYDIWTMQSQWHNTPTINGVQQKAGAQYVAKNVTYNKTSAEFEADIAGAYPKEAQVKSWVRKLTFDRKANTVTMDENYSLDKFVEPFKVHFVTILNKSSDDQKNGDLVL